MNDTKHLFKFEKSRGIPSKKDFNAMPWGRQLEHLKKIQEFKLETTTLSNRVDCKRKTLAAGLKEFIHLYDVKEYYLIDKFKRGVWEPDSVEIHYNKNNQ